MQADKASYDWEINSSVRGLHIPWKELRQHKDLLLRFVRRDFLASYQQTVLGPVWILLQPLLVALTYVAVFKNMIGVSTDGAPSGLFYLIGILLWNYFSESFTAISNSYALYAGIFSKVYFPRIIVSLSILVSNFIRMCIQSLLFVAVYIWYLIYNDSVSPNFEILFVPFYLLLLSCISLGLGLIFASITVKYRDIQNLLYFLLRIFMFVSPVIYPLSIVPSNLRIIFLLNPVTPIIEMCRYAFLGTGYHNYFYLLYALVFAILILITGIILFNRRDGKAMDVI